MQTTPPDGSTSLFFLAPPVPDTAEVHEDYDDELPEPSSPAGGSRPPRGPRNDAAAGGPAGNGAGPSGGRTQGAALRMLKGARQAAAGMKVSDEAIRRVLDDPQDVGPDPNQPHRTRLQRDGLVVTTGQDGMILRVARKR